MALTLGEKLRGAREERGISTSEVAEQTRISPLYIAAIEKDDYKTLPGGIFNKGFVRSYAKYVGFNEQEALQDYAKIVVEAELRENEQPMYRPEVLTDEMPDSSIVPTVIFAVIILGLMTGGVLVLVNYIQNQQSEPAVVSTITNSNANVIVNPEPASTPVPPTDAVPTMASLKIEFSAVGDSISLGSITDGKKADALVTPGTAAVFEPKQSLKLRYSKSRAPFAQLKLNGKPITLPTEPANPRRSSIEFDITAENLPQIWETGQIPSEVPTPVAEATLTPPPQQPPTTTQSGPVPVEPRPAPKPPVETRPTPKPAATPTVRIGTPIPTRTPIVVGRPTGNSMREKPN